MKKLVSIVTICALMVTIGAFSIFADTVPDNTSSYFQDVNITDSDSNVVGHIIYSLNVLDSYISDISYDSDLMLSPKTLVPYTSSTGAILYRVQSTTFGGQSLQGYESWTNTSRAYIYCTPVNVVCTFSNFSDSFINIPQEIRTTLNISTTINDTPVDIGYDADVGNVVSNDISVNLYNDYVYFDFGNQYRRVDGNSTWLPPHSSNICSFTMYIYHTYTSTSTINPCVFRATSVVVRSTDITGRTLGNNIKLYNDSLNLSISANGISSLNSKLDISNNHLNDINTNVQSILDQYTANSQNAQAVTNGTQTNDQTLSTIHQNEDTWFSQNDQALTATGMNDFTYSPQVMSGLTVISDQFNQLWNAIGDWNFVYTFSMMIGLVVLILRHNPQRKKSSAGGKSNATSS